jgi:phosphoglycolate phosphatase
MARAIGAILFDKDGTLLDFEASWGAVYRALAHELAEGDETRATAMLVAGGLDLATGRIRPGAPLAAGNTIDIARLWYPALGDKAFRAMVARIDAIFHENGIRASVPVPGMAETLAALAGRGLVLGVATSDGTAAAKAALAALGVGPLLPHVYGYDSVPEPKPAPDMVWAFCKAAGVTADAVAVVGDNVHDLEMARRAGAGLAVGVLSGTGGEADLRPLADVILPDIRALPDWLHQNRK